jgi:hypothetical protein
MPTLWSISNTGNPRLWWTDQQQFCVGFNWPTFSFPAVHDDEFKLVFSPVKWDFLYSLQIQWACVPTAEWVVHYSLQL